MSEGMRRHPRDLGQSGVFPHGVPERVRRERHAPPAGEARLNRAASPPGEKAREVDLARRRLLGEVVKEARRMAYATGAFRYD